MYVATGQGLLGNNMFAYCANNPVVREDNGGQYWIYSIKSSETQAVNNENGNVTYQTTIKFQRIWQPMLGCSVWDAGYVYVCEATFKYTVRKKGLVRFDNKQSSASLLEIRVVRDALAQEMITAARNQIGGSLRLRTKTGISGELYWHYVAYRLVSTTFQIDMLATHAETADMGSIGKAAIGRDKNAWLFEMLYGWISNFS